jgi:hypothetical protein
LIWISLRLDEHFSLLKQQSHREVALCFSGEKNLFNSQHPSRQFRSFCGVDLRIGGHGDCAPIAFAGGAAFLDFLGEHGGGVFVASVFGGHVFVAGADHFLVNSVAGHAVFGLSQGGISESGRLHGAEHSGGRQEGEQANLHCFPSRTLRILQNWGLGGKLILQYTGDNAILRAWVDICLQAVASPSNRETAAFFIQQSLSVLKSSL